LLIAQRGSELGRRNEFSSRLDEKRPGNKPLHPVARHMFTTAWWRCW